MFEPAGRDRGYVGSADRKKGGTMKILRKLACCFITVSALPGLLGAQQTEISQAAAGVPRLINYSGKVLDTKGNVITGIAGVTFSIYKDQYAGAPLWMETQNVTPDSKGNYAVQLGAMTSQGLPLDLFTSGEARWLGVRVQGAEEQPRVLLLSVPYALKAGDADTLGGKPASAFLATPISSTGSGEKSAGQTTPLAEQANEIVCSSGTACKASFVPLFLTNGGSSRVGDSIMSQSGNTITLKGNLTTSAPTSGVLSTMTGTGNSIAAITGSATATGAAGFTFGVIGKSASNSGRGVFGLSTGSGGVGVIGENNNGPGIGVVGKALPGSTGFGVNGVAIDTSSTGSLHASTAGVWGDSGNSGAIAVLGTADDGNAGQFYNNSSTGFNTLTSVAYGSKSYPFSAYNFANGTSCLVDPGGNLNCTGSKNAVVPLDGGKRRVALSAIESPANWFEDFGSAQLVNGVAVVRLDPDFIQTVNTEKDYRVFPVPNGDCKGLYVAKKSWDSFEIRELGGGTSNIRFDYRITAIRRNYEMVRFADHTNDPDPRKMPGTRAFSARR
jgi:hypothetical protein